MSQKSSPLLLAILIIVAVVTVILVILVILSRRTVINPSSSQVVTACTTAPTTPFGLSASNPQADLIVLTWNIVSGAESYIAYIGDTAGFPISSALSTKQTTFNSISFGNLAIGTTYYLKVKSVNTCGESSLSSEISFNLPFIFPNRFVITNRLNSVVQICDGHDQILGATDVVEAGRFCTDLSSWSFYQDLDKTIRQSARPNRCLTRVAPNTIRFDPCVVNSSQKWFFDTASDTLCSFDNPGTDCLNMPVPFDGFRGPASYGPPSTDAVSDWTFQPV